MKKLHIVLISFLSLISFSSCEHFGELKKPEAVIAVLKNGNVDYWQQIGNAIIEECNMNGVTPIITYNNENADAKGQLSNIVRFDELRRNFDIKGIVVAPVFTADDHSVETAIAEFAGTDMPVVVIDTPLEESASPLKNLYRAFVGTDNKTAGKQFASKCNVSDPSSILIAKVTSSVPATERYDGFCEVANQLLPTWEAADVSRPDALRAELYKYPDVQNVVFLNGSLCNSVTSALSGLNVYTFDVYESFLKELLKDSSSNLKAIMAQNTFEMGHQSVKAILKGASSKNIYIPTIYITSDNIKSEEVRPFLYYYNLN